MKCAVVYSSLTGNTYKLARAIYDGIDSIERFINIEDVNYDEMKNFDTIIFCYWNKRNYADDKLMKFLKTVKDKKIFAAGTQGAYTDSDSSQVMQANIRKAIEDAGHQFLGQFICQGRIDPVKTEQRMKIKKGEKRYLGEEGYQRHVESRNHPDMNDTDEAIRLVKEALSIAN